MLFANTQLKKKKSETATVGKNPSANKLPALLPLVFFGFIENKFALYLIKN